MPITRHPPQRSLIQTPPRKSPRITSRSQQSSSGSVTGLKELPPARASHKKLNVARIPGRGITSGDLRVLVAGIADDCDPYCHKIGRLDRLEREQDDVRILLAT